MRAPRIIPIVIAMIGCVVPIAAHHSPTEYDPMKPVTLKGTIAKVDWVNPHAKIWVEVKEANGTTSRWSIETSTPNALFRQGVTRQSLPSGAAVIVSGWRARDGSLHASGREITFPDGRSLLLFGSVSSQSK